MDHFSGYTGAVDEIFCEESEISHTTVLAITTDGKYLLPITI